MKQQHTFLFFDLFHFRLRLVLSEDIKQRIAARLKQPSRAGAVQLLAAFGSSLNVLLSETEE